MYRNVYRKNELVNLPGAKKYRRISLGLSALMALLVTPLTPLHAEVVPGLGIKVHTFHPKAAPATLVTKAAQRAAERAAKAGTSAPVAVSASAVQQIKALDNEKASRTATQNKIDSRLLHTIRMLQNKPVASGIPTLETDVELDDNNNLYVDITAIVSAGLQVRLKLAGVLIVHTSANTHSIRALVPYAKMEEIAAWGDIRYISPRRKVVSHGASNKSGVFVQRQGVGSSCASQQGTIVSEADAAHKADLARSSFGICGAGVKIGVLSDGVDGLATSQNSGNLGAVTVLAGEAGSGSEGTAMLELIHDIAPDAQLYFASGGGGTNTFEGNIRALRAAGCDIIVDDLTAHAETPFQDGQADSVYGASGTRISTTNGGAITQAVNDVVADGALYFSSAGNEGNLLSNTSGTWQGDFSNGGAASALLGNMGSVHQFAAGVTTNRITSAGSSVNLYWADPLGGSNNDYDLYVLDSTGTSVVGSSTNLQDGTQDPFESVGQSAVVDDNLVVIVKASGADRFMYLGNYDGEFQYATTGQILGHNGSRNSLSVAATPAKVANPNRPGSPTGPSPNAFTAANSIELFSSDGPRHIFFNADGSAITPGNFSSTGGEVLNKPDFTAADGASVTGAAGFTTPFFGTSAAAPHAAAIAALVKSYKPTISNTELVSALNASAIDILGAGRDVTSGLGIIMAYEAISHVVVNGSCGSANTNIASATAPSSNLCLEGSATAVSSGAISYTWSCTGAGGGTTAYCSAPTTTSGTVENAVPNPSGGGTGDGNGDSIADNTQAYVASLPTQSGGGYATIVSTGSLTLTAVTAIAKPADAPASANAVFGAFSFTASGVPGGGAPQAFELYVPYNAAINAALKKNRNTGQWDNVATSITHVGSKTKISFSLTDNGPYDDDLTVGTIHDPIIPAALAGSIPTLSEWSLILLSGLMALFGMSHLLRRKAGSGGGDDLAGA